MKKHIVEMFLGICILASCTIFSACDAEKEDSGAYDRGMAALEVEDYETAISEFQNAADFDGRKAEAYRGEGLVYFEQENYKYAAMMFDLSLENMNFENQEFKEDILYYEAEAYTKNQQTEEAISVYQELEKGENAALAFVMEGKLYLQAGDEEKAEECFKSSEEKEKNIGLCLLIYESYSEVNREADGAGYLEDATSVSAQSGEDYAKLGKVYTYLEDDANAEDCLKKALDMGCSEALNMLGSIYLDENDITSAKELYNKAIEEETNLAQAYNGLAMCAIKEADYDTALSYIEQGLACQDESASQELLFNEIVVYENKGEFETALGKCQSYLEKYPNDEDAQREYKFLQHGS